MATAAITDRIFNFSPGPAVHPVSVLREVQEEMLCLPGAGCSILELSHRDKAFLDILHGAEQSLRDLLGISDEYAVLFLQGGSRLQFSMVAANLLRGTGKNGAVSTDRFMEQVRHPRSGQRRQREGDLRQQSHQLQLLAQSERLSSGKRCSLSLLLQQ